MYFHQPYQVYLIFLPIVNKRAIMQQVSVFCFVLFCSVSGFCVSFLLFLGWVFIRMYD